MDLYSPTIKELSKNPPNFGENGNADHIVKAYNSYCGDKFRVQLVGGETLSEVMFDGHGCAVSKASCAILTEIVGGKSWEQVGQMCDRVVSYLSNEGESIDGLDARLKDFVVVRKYPGRLDCAILAWRELGAYARQMIEQGS